MSQDLLDLSNLAPNQAEEIVSDLIPIPVLPPQLIIFEGNNSLVGNLRTLTGSVERNV